MAKSVIEEQRRRAAQACTQTSTETSTVGEGVVGFRKTYTQDEWERIETERAAMRQRLSAPG